tara:strand:+ start:448 stop:825 length:378 start_codon:yes stop_codon:yes gene_type:complete
LSESSVRNALPKPNVLELSKYDITQRIMETLVNTCHRNVLFSVLNNAKDANQISDELGISLSAVYKTLTNLEEMSLVSVEKFVFNHDRKKIKLYKSRIGKAEIKIGNNDAILELYPNRTAVNNQK